MPAKNCPPLVKRLTILVGLVSLSAPISLPAAARLEANSNVLNSPAQNNTLTHPQRLAQTPPVRNSLSVELETTKDAFSTLSAALTAANLNDDLARRGAFTIFAPTDEAFENLPPGTLQKLLRPENKDKLVKVLTYHLVPGKTNSFNIKSGRRKTFEGNRLTIRASRKGEITVNKAKIITADIPASNGIIHAIDRVLLPPGFSI